MMCKNCKIVMRSESKINVLPMITYQISKTDTNKEEMKTGENKNIQRVKTLLIDVKRTD